MYNPNDIAFKAFFPCTTKAVKNCFISLGVEPLGYHSILCLSGPEGIVTRISDGVKIAQGHYRSLS